MSPYTKAAMFLIRLVGFGFVAVALVLLAGDLFLMLVKHEQARTLMLGLESGLLFLGMVILWKSCAIARRFTQDLEDE